MGLNQRGKPIIYGMKGQRKNAMRRVLSVPGSKPLLDVSSFDIVLLSYGVRHGRIWEEAVLSGEPRRSKELVFVSLGDA
jgi:hypothetical protein